MPNILKEVRVLREEGKLHTKLITRIRMLIAISLVLAGISAYNVISRGTGGLIAIGLFAIGLVVGMFVFSRMNVIEWNEETEVVEAGRMDMIGYAMIALYIVFEIGLRTYLQDFYPISATGFVLAAVSGTLLGRSIGTIVEVHGVYTRTHT